MKRVGQNKGKRETEHMKKQHYWKRWDRKRLNYELYKWKIESLKWKLRNVSSTLDTAEEKLVRT